MKVLLFANDLLPFAGMPTSGGGLRCFQIFEGLNSHGIEVVVSMPSFTYLVEQHKEKLSKELQENLWQWGKQDEILKRVNPDAVIFSSNWDHYALEKKPSVPLIIDLHGSRIIETRLFNTPVDVERKIDVFSKADCIITAGQKQRKYFYGWLLQAGRVYEEDFIKYIPISLNSNLPQREGSQAYTHIIDSSSSQISSFTNSPVVSSPATKEQNDYPIFITGGGWFPWQDQSDVIFEICHKLKEKREGIIQIFGTPHANPNPSKEEQKIFAIYKKVEELAKSNPQIVINGYWSREELIKYYAKASVAVECMRYNLERELAFTTRTIEYLWCGLPVIYNNYAEISEHIAEYDAGWTIDPDVTIGSLREGNNPKDSHKNNIKNNLTLAEVLNEIYQDPAAIKQKSLNAQRLVRDRFLTEKTILPLVEFLKNPHTSSTSATLHKTPAKISLKDSPGFMRAMPKMRENLILRLTTQNVTEQLRETNSTRGLENTSLDSPLQGSEEEFYFDRIEQDLVIPDDNLTRLEFTAELLSLSNSCDLQVEIKLAKILGSRMSSSAGNSQMTAKTKALTSKLLTLSYANVGTYQKVSLNLKNGFIKSNNLKGGDCCRLSIAIKNCPSRSNQSNKNAYNCEASLALKVFETKELSSKFGDSYYPYQGIRLFNGSRQVMVEGINNKNTAFSPPFIALNFLTGYEDIHEYQILIKRAVYFVASGQWRRILRALRYRLPVVYKISTQKLRKKVFG